MAFLNKNNMVRQAHVLDIALLTFFYLILGTYLFLGIIVPCFPLSNCSWQENIVNPGWRQILRGSDIFPEEQHSNLAETHESLGISRVSVFQEK